MALPIEVNETTEGLTPVTILLCIEGSRAIAYTVGPAGRVPRPGPNAEPTTCTGASTVVQGVLTAEDGRKAT